LLKQKEDCVCGEEKCDWDEVEVPEIRGLHVVLLEGSQR